MITFYSAIGLSDKSSAFSGSALFSRSGMFDLLIEQLALALFGGEAEFNKAEQEITSKARAMLAPLEALTNSHIKPVI